jgi:hypothetical protein
MFGSAMLASIVLAVFAIRRRDFASHGAWMTRGYAIALGAGTQTLTMLPWVVIFGPIGAADEAPRTVLMTAGWVINLAVAEYGIRRRPAHRSSRTLLVWAGPWRQAVDWHLHGRGVSWSKDSNTVEPRFWGRMTAVPFRRDAALVRRGVIANEMSRRSIQPRKTGESAADNISHPVHHDQRQQPPAEDQQVQHHGGNGDRHGSDRPVHQVLCVGRKR